MHLRLLRLFLGFAALAWGISVVGVFLDWSTAVDALQGLGAQPIAYDRMLDYWLRMAAGAFALMGGWYLVLMIWPQKFWSAIPWFGGLMVAEGVILLVHGLRLSLPPFPFYADTSACFFGGGAILYLSRQARLGQDKPRSEHSLESRNAPGLDPLFAHEIEQQKSMAMHNNVRWVRRFKACSIASVVFGVGAWFLCCPDPADRDWGTAFLTVVSAWLTGICLLSLLGSHRSDPRCPRCKIVWVEEEQIWPAWKHCPGCGLKMVDEVG